MSRTQLVSLNDIQPARYNPREADQQRLEFLKLSLRKLGFLLPLYALPGGHLLSGHQRSLCVKLLNGQQVPVSFVDIPDERVRNVNLLFNRATNDFTPEDTSDSVWGDVSLERLVSLADDLPEVDWSDPNSFARCLFAQEMDIEQLAKSLTAQYDSHAMEMCAKLLGYGIVMPVVMTRSGRIVNGQYRLMAALDRRSRRVGTAKAIDTYPVVLINDDEAELSDMLLNMISMKFTVERQYADQLRFGAFRRANNVVEDLLPAYRLLVDDFVWKPAKASLRNEAEFYHKFRKIYGERICDIGAGQRRTRPILEAKGIHVSDWEPYPLDWRDEADGIKQKPSLALARQVSDQFLDDVESGIQFTTVGLPAVLNSVPFRWDRMCVIALAHALVGVKGQLVGTARHNENKKLTDTKVIRVNEDGQIRAAHSLFHLDYEPGIIIGDINVMPKVQKLHTQAEMEADLKQFFSWVRVKTVGKVIMFHCRAPKRVSPPVLKAALLHEFNLPYEDGQTIDRGERALEVFGKRLGIDFAKVQEVRNPNAD